MGSRPKRTKNSNSRVPGSWDCSVCTYKNDPEAFKCAMCDIRKGTSTRKPRLSSTVVDQQITVQNFLQQQQADAYAKAIKGMLLLRPPDGGIGSRRSGDCDGELSAFDECSTSAGPPHTPDTLSSDPLSPASTSKTSSPSVTRSSTPTPSTSSVNNVHLDAVPNRRGRPKRKRPPGSDPGTMGGGESHISSTILRGRLKDVDRNSARTITVTVNDITVVITDYKLKDDVTPEEPAVNGDVIDEVTQDVNNDSEELPLGEACLKIDEGLEEEEDPPDEKLPPVKPHRDDSTTAIASDATAATVSPSGGRRSSSRHHHRGDVDKSAPKVSKNAMDCSDNHLELPTVSVSSASLISNSVEMK